MCENIPEWVCDDIKSIFIPPNRKVTLHNFKNFKGKQVVFTKSVECLPEVNFELISKYGIKVHKLDHSQEDGTAEAGF